MSVFQENLGQPCFHIHHMGYKASLFGDHFPPLIIDPDGIIFEVDFLFGG